VHFRALGFAAAGPAQCSHLLEPMRRLRESVSCSGGTCSAHSVSAARSHSPPSCCSVAEVRSLQWPQRRCWHQFCRSRKVLASRSRYLLVVVVAASVEALESSGSDLQDLNPHHQFGRPSRIEHVPALPRGRPLLLSRCPKG